MFRKRYPSFRRFDRPIKRGPSAPNSDLMYALQAIEMNPQQLKEIEVQAPYESEHDFKDFPFDKRLQENIAQKGYISPTPIQDQAIMAVLDKRDVLGIANTGTGKTAAFLLPLIQKIIQNPDEKVLILTPTRELAFQIDEELKGFAHGLHIYSALCIGGANINRQIWDLEKRPQFVIGTPGRIKDLMQEKALYLSDYTNVVLDEADRMVDIGFIDDIRYFISHLPKERQSLFFSATISGKVEEILKAFVKDPVTISVKKRETASSIQQEVVRLDPSVRKVDALHDILAQEGFEKVLIFGRTKWGVQKLADDLYQRGFRVGAIHGNKNQNQRQSILNQFKENRIQVLIATDVASRGLDIPDVTHVINYDLPESYDAYVHRIGRTGRANKKGVAITFV